MGNLVNSKLLNDDLNDTLKKHGIEKDTTVIFKHNKAKERDAFVKVFQLGLNYFIDILSPAGCKMFMFFMSSLAYGNYLEVNQVQIMEKLKLSKRSVQKAINELLELNVIAITPDMNDKRRNVYYINQYIVWKGNPSDRKKSISKYKDTFTNPYQLSIDFKGKK